MVLVPIKKSAGLLSLGMGIVFLLLPGCSSVGSTFFSRAQKPPTNAAAARAKDEKINPQSPAAWERRELEEELVNRLLADPADADSRARLAQLLHQEKRFSAARKQYERALASLPADNELRVRYARLLADIGADREALNQVHQTIGPNSISAEALAIRGRVFEKMGRNAEAFESYRQAWEMSPPSREAGLALARWENARGDLQRELKQLQRCLAFFPNDAQTRRQLADALERQGSIDESLKHWRFLADRGDFGSEPIVHLARLEAERGNRERAKLYLAQVERLGVEKTTLRDLRQDIVVSKQKSSTEREYPTILGSRQR